MYEEPKKADQNQGDRKMLQEVEVENILGDYLSKGARKLAELQSDCKTCQQIRGYVLQNSTEQITDRALQLFSKKCGIQMNVLFYERKRNQCFVAPQACIGGICTQDWVQI